MHILTKVETSSTHADMATPKFAPKVNLPPLAFDLTTVITLSSSLSHTFHFLHTIRHLMIR